MKKKTIFLAVIIILVLILVLFKIVYFSSTQVKIIDIDGVPIINAQVKISYSCQEAVLDVGGGEHFRQFGYREGVTNSQGVVHFNSLNKEIIYNLPFFMFNCHKDILVLKEGYCPNYHISAGACIGDYSNNLLSKKEILELPVYFAKDISWFKGGAILVLKKIDNYQVPVLNEYCNLFKEDCEKNKSFREAVKSLDSDKCIEGCKFTNKQGVDEFDSDCDISNINRISYVYECLTEIAFAKKDVSICDEIYYTQDGDGRKNLRAGVDSHEYNTKEFQKRCYNILALELKDISLCKNSGNDRAYEHCKLEVIKKIGDISKCSLITIKDIRELCEVYLS
jgi:hypothetical protein